MAQHGMRFLALDCLVRIREGVLRQASIASRYWHFSSQSGEFLRCNNGLPCILVVATWAIWVQIILEVRR